MVDYDISYSNGRTTRTAKLSVLLAMPDAVRATIKSIEVIPGMVTVPDFSESLRSGATKNINKPIVITNDMFSEATFPNLESLDFGSGVVAGIEDGALANLPKLTSLRWTGALDQKKDGSTQTKYNIEAFLNKRLPENKRTKLTLNCVVGKDASSGSPVSFSLKDILQKFCLKQPVEGLELPMQTDDAGNIRPVIKESEGSLIGGLLTGRLRKRSIPITMGIGFGVATLGFLGVTAVSGLLIPGLTLVSGATKIILGQALLTGAIGAGIGGLISSIPKLIASFTKKGRFNAKKHRILAEEKAIQKKQEKYLANVQKMKQAQKRSNQAIREQFSAAGISGIIKKPIAKLKEMKAEQDIKVFRSRALRKDELISSAVNRLDLHQADIETLESSAGKSFAFNGTVEEIRKRKRNLVNAVSTYGAGSVKAQHEERKLKGAVEGVKTRKDGDSILAKVNSGEASMSEHVEAIKSKVENVREKTFGDF